MEGARFKEETHFGTFPNMIAFVRFTLWSLMNSLFFLIMGQMFPTEHSEKYPGQFNPFEVSKIAHCDVPQEESIPDLQTSKEETTEQYFEQSDQQGRHSFNENEHQDDYKEPAEIIDAQVSEPSSSAVKPQKRRRQRKPKKENTDGTRVEQGDGEVKQHDVDSSSNQLNVVKRNSSMQKSKKERDNRASNEQSSKLPKRKDLKCVRKAESWPLSNKEAQGNWSSRKTDKEEMELSEMQANRSERRSSYSHSMLRKLTPPSSTSLPDLQEVIIKPIRQPIGPVLGHIGFSKEYRNSRRAALC